MPLKRLYDNWQQVRAASGTPGSGQRRVWRRYLQEHPAVAYWGDSWFSTPLYRNLHWHSFARIDGMAVRLGGPGLSAARMCTPSACRMQAERLKTHEFDLLCVSIGGNDCLGGRLARIFADAAPMDAGAAYRRVVDSGLFEDVRARYEVLLSAMATVGGRFRVVGHGYAPLAAGRIGARGAVDIKNLGLAAPLIGNVGPWLWPAVRATFDGDREEAARFARRLLVDGFRERVLVPSRAAYDGLFSFVDFSGLDETGEADFWYDEIHPTAEGFGVLATGYNAMLRAALPTGKREAVRLALGDGP